MTKIAQSFTKKDQDATRVNLRQRAAHGKVEPIAGMVVAMALLGAAVLSHSERVRNSHPALLPALFTFLVLALVMLAKKSLYRFVSKVGLLRPRLPTAFSLSLDTGQGDSPWPRSHRHVSEEARYMSAIIG